MGCSLLPEFADWVLNDLKTKFNIVPEQCILKCLEIGVNIVPPISTNEILDNCFLHKTKSFEYQKNSDEGKYKQVQHSQYVIKVYNKALHYRSKGFDINNEIMRFEIKYTKMEKLNKLGIFSLQELIDFGLYNFKKELMIEWENVIFYDKTTRIDSLAKGSQKTLLEYSNPNYWTGLLENKKIENFKYHRKQLRKITLQFSINIQALISELICKKVDYLNLKTTHIDTLTILSKKVVSKSVCKVTGFDISMQKEESVLLSHTGLKYYYKMDKKLFEQIKRKYLSKKWIDADFEIQVKEIAHNIRNKNNNKNIKQNRIYKIEQINMFSFFNL